MGCECDHIGKTDRGGQHTGSYHAGNVGDVGHQIGADLIGNLAEARPIRHPGVRGEAGDDNARFVFQRDTFHFVVVDLFGLRVNAVMGGFI